MLLGETKSFSTPLLSVWKLECLWKCRKDHATLTSERYPQSVLSFLRISRDCNDLYWGEAIYTEKQISVSVFVFKYVVTFCISICRDPSHVTDLMLLHSDVVCFNITMQCQSCAIPELCNTTAVQYHSCAVPQLCSTTAACNTRPVQCQSCVI